MLPVATVLVLLCLITLLSVLTRRWTIPYPTIMVLTGLVVALIPGLPEVKLTPEVVFLVFLPPLLYAAAWQMPWNEFKKNIRPISMLAFGLVLVTTVVVAVVAKQLIPDLPWAAAFALGAIISPPDAIAATSITRSLPIPRRIITILEGESLLNDATGLVVYRMTVITASTGAFSLSSSCLFFLWSAIGGVLLGLLAGWCVVRVHRQLDDPVVETMLSLLTPYAVYLPCEAIHVSGVLGAVTAGLYVQQRANWLLSSATRLHATAVWESVLFVLNGLTFIFIGLGLRDVIAAIDDEPLWWNISIATVILLVTIAVRLLWVYPAAHIPRWFSRTLRARDPAPPAAHLWIIGWTGMRGVVSLAAALALPLDFPKRDLILFIVFGVILGTLVVQGLSLPWMIGKLNIKSLSRPSREQEMDARLWMLAAAGAYLEREAASSTKNHRDVQYLREHFESHANRIVAKLELEFDEIDPETRWRTPVCRDLHLGALKAQRERLTELEQSGIIENHLTQQLSREIDLEETHLISSSKIHLGSIVHQEA